MHQVDNLDIAAWTPANLPDSFQVTRYRMSTQAHDTLTGWANEKSTRDQSINMVLRGLSEILASLAPEISYMKLDWDRDLRSTRLKIYFMGNVSQDPNLRKRLRGGFNYWLDAMHSDRPSEVRQSISESIFDDDCWLTYSVGTELLPQTGLCPTPRDPQLFDVLCAHVVKELAGKQIIFPEGETKFLVPQTPQASPFEGIELVAFPPQRGEKHNYWYSEVITITTATFPEKPDIYILAKPSMRNWGPVRFPTAKSKAKRYLDVFFPSAYEPGDATFRHSTFQFLASRTGEDRASPLAAKWAHKETQDVYGAVRFLANSTMDIPKDGVVPVTDATGLRALPRLGTIHKDRDLPGGTGLGWPDRQAIADSIDPVMETAGFKRAVGLERIKPATLKAAKLGFSLENDFTGKANDPVRMTHLAKALAASGNNDRTLDFFVFNLLDDTPAMVVEQFVSLFGAPTTTENGELYYADDDVRVRFQKVNAGIFAKEIAEPELSEAEKSQFSRSQQLRIIDDKRQEFVSAVEKEMRGELTRLRGGRSSMGFAIIEIPASHKGQRGDPYILTRRELARHNLLPQVVLLEPDASPEKKLRSSIRDCLRMLGVIPLDAKELPYAPAGLTIIQINEDFYYGKRRPALSVPVATRAFGEILECALPAADGTPQWMSYAEACRKLFIGEYENFGRSRAKDTNDKFGVFIKGVLESLSEHQRPFLMVEAEKTAHRWGAMKNSNLKFDELQIGNRTITPASLSNLRFARMVLKDDKLPSHYHDEKVQTVSGLFNWDDAGRTFYVIKSSPQTLKKDKKQLLVSRHGIPGSNEQPNVKDRKLMQLDEVCISFMQDGDQPKLLAHFSNELRGVHAQYDDDTRDPFPLHEAILLEKAISY